MNTQILPLLVPNTDVVIITERRHISKIGGTKEQPLIWIKGIPRAFVLANSKNLRKDTIDAVATPVSDDPPVSAGPAGGGISDGVPVRDADGS